jgi:hypothetical protein
MAVLQGSWMTMFFTVIVSLYVFSHAYNLLLFLWYENSLYQINSHMGVTNARYKSMYAYIFTVL